VRSADAAREAGFGEVASADGALSELVALVTRRFAGSVGRLLYLAGEDRAGDLAGGLAARGIAVDTVVIYRAVAAESLPADLVQALANARLDGALHYSRRSVITLIELSRSADVLNAVLNLAHYCLSEEIAVPLRKAGAERISVALRPLEAALIGLL
jgi:uroporphyrinogen-III synthase